MCNREGWRSSGHRRREKEEIRGRQVVKKGNKEEDKKDELELG